MKRECCRPVARKGLRTGAAAVEMALVAPVAFALVFGIMQIGYAFMVQHVLQNAARKACRVAILPSSSNANVNAVVNSVLTPLNLTGAVTSIALNGAAADISTAKYGDQISVTIAVPFANILLFDVSFATGARNITGADTLRYE